MDAAAFRSEFPVLERLAYLNAGSAGPLSRATFDALVAGERLELESGRGGKPYFEAVLQARERLRAALAGAIAVYDDPAALLADHARATSSRGDVQARE